MSTPLKDYVDAFVADREAALLSLDKAVIDAYLKKYGAAPIPQTHYWSAVHKARVLLKGLSPEAKAVSREWLLLNGHTVPREEA